MSRACAAAWRLPEPSGPGPDEQFLALLEATSAIVAIVDPATREVRYLNRTGRATTGLGPDRPDRPLRLEELYAEESREAMVHDSLPRALATGTWTGVSTLTDGHGGAVPVQLEMVVTRGADGAPEYMAVMCRDVTAQLAASKALEDSEARLRAVVTSHRDALVMMDRAGRITFWSPSAEQLFGHAAASILGGNGGDLLAPGESRSAWLDAFECLQGKAGEGRLLALQALRADGTPFLAEVSVRGVEPRGGWEAATTFRDLTRMRETTDVFRRQHVLLRTIIDALPDCIYAKDHRGRKTLANLADVRSLGRRSQAEVLGRTDLELLDGETAAGCYADDVRVLTRGEPVVNRQERIVNAAGISRWLETTKLPLRDEQGRIIGLVGIGHDITERRRTEDQLRKLSRAVEQTPASVVITDPQGNIEYANPKFCAVTGYRPEEVIGQNPRLLKTGHTSPEAYRELWERISAGQEWRGEFQNRKKNGELYWESAVISPITGDSGRITHFLAVKEDITERKRAENERSLMEIQLRHAQKLESIGELAAGVAHEINTPMQYVSDNTRFLMESFAELSGVIRRLRDAMNGWRDRPALAPAVAEAEQVLRRADLDFLLEEVPQAIEQTLEGATRVTTIVRALKEFSHPGTEQKTTVDLNRAIESTITVARNEWKYVADLVTELDPDLPLVPCLPGELNQVLLNLIVNAAHAIGDAVHETREKGRIVVRTRADATHAEIQVQDTGTGIPVEVRDRVFDPFFTTKPVGKGSGQGLAIARSVVVDKHEGTIGFETALGQGTTFTVRLPLATTERVDVVKR